MKDTTYDVTLEGERRQYYYKIDVDAKDDDGEDKHARFHVTETSYTSKNNQNPKIDYELDRHPTKEELDILDVISEHWALILLIEVIEEKMREE